MKGLRPLSHLGDTLIYTFLVLQKTKVFEELQNSLNETLEECGTSYEIDLSYLEVARIQITSKTTTSENDLELLKTKLINLFTEKGITNFIIKLRKV